jgi:hypothetical protein
MARTALVTVFHSGQRVTQGEASIGATLNTIAMGATKDGCSVAESPHSPLCGNVANATISNPHFIGKVR